ncbi:MAG: S-layer homology domain-containing protein, partial [Oscillospiraceae bacterium]|nr:S-layer homology domain-containing protein [Oscillospiraceae bacterium]
AHVFDKIFSVEMGALNNSTFKLNIDQYNQNIYACFASGIQKNVLHGYSSIVGSNRLRWPGNDGMLTSYNERFSERQPSSIHYKDWTTMIARYQKMLQQGTSKMDLAILRTDYQPDSIHRKYELLLTPPQFERGEYFPDSTMQQLGYTYDYFAPALLEKTDYIEFRDGLINPDTMGYQAVILYQDHIALSSAQKLLEFAQQGLPVVFVNGVQEILQWPTDTEFVVKDFGEACSKSLFTSDSDADVQAVIDQIKALPTTRTIDSSAGGIENDAHLALQELGVYPRAAFHEKSHNLVTAMRETDDEIYLFAYNHRWDQSSAYEAEITLDALGKPYNYNAYTGVVESIPYTVADGKTVFTLAIEPGDATMVVFDKTAANNLHVVSTTADKAYIINGSVIPVASVSGDYTVTLSDGAVITNSITAPDNIPLTSWDLEVQKWTADPDGLKEYTTEDRPAGWASDIIGADMSQILFSSDTSPQYSTTEYWWPTLKTTIDVGTITDLDPWKDIAAVGPDVSGIGVYETSFTLPGDWGDDNGAYLSIGSISGNTADVYVNGEKVQTVNPRDCAVDITDWLVSGENTVKIEVTSILQNALIELYRAGGMYASAAGANRPYPGWQANVPSNQPRDFGMTGDVELVTYTIANFSHTIDVAGGTGSGVYNPGDEVTITATAPAGKRFSAWTLTADTFTLTPTQLRANPLTFVMPDEDITLTAVFTDIPGYAPGAVSPVSGGGAVTRYTITISAGTNGAITPASASVADGSNQTFAIKAHEGYVVADVLVDGVSVGAVTSYTFTNVKAAHTISATFKEDDSGAVNPPQQPTPTPTSPPPGEVFTDVPKDQWYYDAVYYVYDRGIFKGTAETLFSPDMELTRAMFVTVMGRLAESIGDTATGFSNPFSDVPADQYYTDYVAWAAAHDIVLGYDETTFGPDDYVTREQMAAIFVRFADYMGIELGDDIEKTFPDADSISGWAKESVERAVAAGLMQGDTNGMFQPLGTAIRSEVAQLFKNFVEKYLEDGFEIPQPETIDEVVNEVVDESADESADEVVEEVTDEVTDETVDESADETVDESADETVDESADGSAE